MRRSTVIIVMGLLCLIPLISNADVWVNGYGTTATHYVPTGSGHVCPISVSGQVVENPSDPGHSLRGRLRYGHFGVGEQLIYMSGPGMYAGYQGRWNFQSGYWDMYLSGGAGVDTIANWSISRGTPYYYE